MTRKKGPPLSFLVRELANNCVHMRKKMHDLRRISVMSYLSHLGVCHMYKPCVALSAVHLKTTGFRLYIDYQNQNLTSFAP